MFTLSCHYEARHAVRDTGACCQEGDAHDDIWDTQCEAYDCYLTRKKAEVELVSFAFYISLYQIPLDNEAEREIEDRLRLI